MQNHPPFNLVDPDGPNAVLDTIDSLSSKPSHALLVDAATILCCRSCSQPPLSVEHTLHFGVGGRQCAISIHHSTEELRHTQQHAHGFVHKASTD